MHIIGLIFLVACVVFFLRKFLVSIEIGESGTEYDTSNKKRRNTIDGEIIDVEPIEEDPKD